MKTAGKALVCCVLLVGAMVAGMLLSPFKHTERIIEEQHDTLILHDTFVRTKPVPVYVQTIDTIRIRVNDTIYVNLPKEQKTYCDSTYYAVVSGYEPSLDSIAVYQNTKIITNTITITEKAKPKRFGVGVQVGYGATLQGTTVRLSPYVGVGLSYNLIQF